MTKKEQVEQRIMDMINPAFLPKNMFGMVDWKSKTTWDEIEKIARKGKQDAELRVQLWRGILEFVKEKKVDL